MRIGSSSMLSSGRTRLAFLIALRCGLANGMSLFTPFLSLGRTHRMRRATPIAIAITAVALVGSSSAERARAASWKHVTVDQRSGPVVATLSYERREQADGVALRDVSLAVRGSGTAPVHHTIANGVFDHPSLDLTLRNVWGDSVPEAVLDVSSCSN